MNGLTLLIVTPEGEKLRIACEAVTFFARDNEKGEGGGSVGIRRGHLPALAALEPGSVVFARADGKDFPAGTVSRGFVSVKNDVVTVIAETADNVHSENSASNGEQ